MNKSITLTKKKYPDKTTLNLAMRDVSNRKLSAIIPVAVLVAVAIALFTKLAVIDLLQKVDKAQYQAVSAQEQLDAVSGQTTDYDEVQAEYLRCMGATSSADAALVDRLEIIDMVDDILMKKAGVSSFSVSDNTLSVSLFGVTLQEVSSILEALKQSEIVDYVNVYTADTDSSSEDIAVTMTIALKQNGGEADA